MNTDSGRLYCENVCLNATSTTSTSILVPGGGGGGVHDQYLGMGDGAAEALKP